MKKTNSIKKLTASSTLNDTKKLVNRIALETKSQSQKKKASNDTGDVWELHPVKNNHNIVRLPLFDEGNFTSLTFDKSRANFFINECQTSDSGFASGTSIITIYGMPYTVNLTFKELCKALYS